MSEGGALSRDRAKPESRTPLRIAVLANLAPRKLGSFENWLLELCERARRRGHRMRVLTREPVHPEVAARLASLGAEWGRVDAVERSPVAAARELARSADVVHLNLFAPRSTVALAAYAAWPARVVYVDRVSDDGAPPHSTLRSLLSRTVDRITMLRVRAAAGVSDYVRDRMAGRFALPASRVRTIYDGVDVSRFRGTAAAPATEAGPLRVLAAANLIPEKGIDHAIRACALLGPDAVRLTVAGDGPEAGRLRALADELGVADRVAFLGLRNDLPELLRAADVFVHPATWAEAFGLTIVEAMASGRAVVASRIGGIPELLVDGESGLLVPAGDHAALAAALDRLRRDPPLRAVLGRAARARAQERFSMEACVDAHLSWCEAAARRPRRSGAPAAPPASRAAELPDLGEMAG